MWQIWQFNTGELMCCWKPQQCSVIQCNHAVLWLKSPGYCGSKSFTASYSVFSSFCHARNHLGVVWEDYFIQPPQRLWTMKNKSISVKKKKNKGGGKESNSSFSAIILAFKDLYHLDPWQQGHNRGVSSIYIQRRGGVFKGHIYIHSDVSVYTQPIKKQPYVALGEPRKRELMNAHTDTHLAAHTCTKIGLKIPICRLAL